MITILFLSNSFFILSGLIPEIFAFPCRVSVCIPACAPDKLIALNPNDLIAIAISVHEINSPVESNKSNSLGEGSFVIELANSINSSVVLPIADTITTTLFPSWYFTEILFAIADICLEVARELPPYFCTNIGKLFSIRYVIYLFSTT